MNRGIQYVLDAVTCLQEDYGEIVFAGCLTQDGLAPAVVLEFKSGKSVRVDFALGEGLYPGEAFDACEAFPAGEAIAKHQERPGEAT